MTSKPDTQCCEECEDFKPLKELGSKWRGDTKQRSVWFEKRNAKNTLHPTQKPLGIISKMIVNSTDEGDTVLDPFMGSGTTLHAAELLNRNAVGIEISPEYCAIAQKRLDSQPESLFTSHTK